MDREKDRQVVKNRQTEKGTDRRKRQTDGRKRYTDRKQRYTGREKDLQRDTQR